MLPLFLFITLSHLHSTKAGESVIFEQIGTMIGSTSYLHVHIPLSIRALVEQHNKYYLNTLFKSPDDIAQWLYSGVHMEPSGKSWKDYSNETSAMLYAIKGNAED